MCFVSTLFLLLIRNFAAISVFITTLAGLPITTELSGILPRTTEPAPIIQFEPIVVFAEKIIPLFGQRIVDVFAGKADDTDMTGK